MEQKAPEGMSQENLAITIGQFISWLSLLDPTQQVWIYDHKQGTEVPFDPTHDIDHDKYWGGGSYGSIKRIVIDK